jgi:fructose-1,6-bisphosphatase-3
VMERLKSSFTNSEKLQKHTRFLFSKGSMYLIHDQHLLYHGCIPMTPDGSFRTHVIGGSGPKEFLDHVEQIIRKGYFASAHAPEKQRGLDMFWYLWSGADSPLFGKDKMATFERYFIADPATHKEPKDPYYTFRDQPDTARRILEAFGLDPAHAHIVNGHVPVKVNKGESPVKAGGRLLVIDGGFAKAYQNETGIAGYTLIDNPDALILVAHSPFVSAQKAIEDEIDIASAPHILETYPHRLRVRDTDLGQSIEQRIEDLKALLQAYREGVIKER